MTSNGPSHPHGLSSGIGEASRSRSSATGVPSSPASPAPPRAAVANSEPSSQAIVGGVALAWAARTSPDHAVRKTPGPRTPEPATGRDGGHAGPRRATLTARGRSPSAEAATPRPASSPNSRRAGLIAAEDTRRLRRLATSARRAGSPPALVPYDDQAVQAARTAELLAELAGRPGRAAHHRRGHAGDQRPRLPAGHAAVEAGTGGPSWPGPSAVTPPSPCPACRRPVRFEGFPPRGQGERAQAVRRAAPSDRRTQVLLRVRRRLVRSTLAADGRRVRHRPPGRGCAVN